MKALIRKNIRNLTPYSSARSEYSNQEGVFLDANENPYGNYNRYPDPQQRKLKKMIAEMKNCSPQQIFIGNGSDEVIDVAFRIFCEPGKDEVLTFSPSYGMYEVSAQIHGVKIIAVPLNPDFQIDTTTILPYLENPNLKLIFICSPNNPTGNLLHTEDIEFILNNFKGIVVVDEAYIEFSKQKSFVEKLSKYSNLIVSQTLSKAWGVAGIRLGIAYMNEELLSYYNKVKAPYNISIPNQEIAIKTLENKEQFQKIIEEIITERQLLISAFEQFPFIKKTLPTDANFILIEVDNANQLYRYLLREKVIVRNRNSQIKNCLRISVGTPAENKKLITLLKKYNNE